MRGIRQIAPSSAIRSVVVPWNSTLYSYLSTVLLSVLAAIACDVGHSIAQLAASNARIDWASNRRADRDFILGQRLCMGNTLVQFRVYQFAYIHLSACCIVKPLSALSNFIGFVMARK